MLCHESNELCLVLKLMLFHDSNKFYPFLFEHILGHRVEWVGFSCYVLFLNLLVPNESNGLTNGY